jgi:pimeloyl-ACP methyl ester carboxylesterase
VGGRKEEMSMEGFVPDPVAHFREAGTGQGLVCVHSSASSSGQWRALMDRLSDGFRVIAVDLYGYGKSPAWPEGCRMYLDDEISLLEPAFRSAGDPFHLVGHSYGGAIALKAALNSALQ